MRAAAAGAKVLTYSGELAQPAGAPADVYPLSLDLSIWDTALTLATPLGEVTLRSALVGRAAVGDIAAAVAVGVALGVPLDVITAGVEALAGVPGQLESIDEGQPFAVIVDEAATPAALERALQAVRDCGAQHVITVMGCPGDRCAAGAAATLRCAHAC
jgi:UDP-N-acetylmuramoyl-L-alanyl-D-glutamate--2,6-diaminopimelate ligase